MSYDALIERFDRHLVRIDEELRLSRAAHERMHAESEERHAQSEERHAQSEERHAQLREEHRKFIREMTLRIHRGGEKMARALDTLTATMHEDRADDRAQLKANTAAVWAMLDRFNEHRGENTNGG